MRTLTIQVLVLACLSSAPAAASTWHVRRDAGPGGDGTSWAAAFQTVQDGLAAAQPGDQVWVAAAVYRPGTGANPPTVSFVLPANVALYGGFAGDETTLAERDWEANPTVLSGDLSLNDDPGVPATLADNCHHVVRVPGGTSAAVLDGFVVTAGNAVAGPGLTTSGGGLWVQGSATLRHLVVEENRAAAYGGGLAVEFGYALVERSTPGSRSAGNVATQEGGGIDLFYAGIVLSGTTIAYNHAQSGGGIIYGGSGGVLPWNSILWGNTATGGNPPVLNQQVANGLSAAWTGNGNAVEGWTAPWNADPLWVDPLGPDGIAGTDDDDFRLSCVSPYIDRGSNTGAAGSTHDLAGGPRFLDDPATPDQGSGTAPIVDLGPYEFACGCDDAQPYCDAVANSTGGLAAISWSGSTSVLANAFTLLVTDGVPLKFAHFFYGTQTAPEVPFGDGVRCVGGSLFRTGAFQLDANGAGSRQLDFTLPPAGSGPGQVLPGSTWYFQCIVRDPAGGPMGFNASNALEATFCP